MITEAARTANALGGKTARACDSCLKKRARWFCAADDAFLCQACDTSVHSANQLASRHERVRLETSSFRPNHNEAKVDVENSPPSWHQGFRRKARTPRNRLVIHQPKDEEKMAPERNPLPLVPEISGDQETSPDDHESEDQQLLFCRVPVFDPFAAGLCTTMNDEVHNVQSADVEILTANELNVLFDDDRDQDLDMIPDLIASDAELAEFAADVESLLGTAALDEDSRNIEALSRPPMLCKEEDQDHNVLLKVEEDEDDQEVQAVIACHLDPALDIMGTESSLNWDFDSGSPMDGEELEEMKMANEMSIQGMTGTEEEKRILHLKLNYEEVITAWASQGSPWADGRKPDFNLDDWPDFMVTSPNDLLNPYGAGGGRKSSRDGEREARVSRYREKRRTRLFSKKIRYEVRKLNAEKRPRMKGRFVKRTSFAGPNSFPNYLINK